MKELTPEEKEKRQKRFKERQDTIGSNYYNTFIKPVETAVNKHFKSEEIKEIKISSLLNKILDVYIYDYNGNIIHNKELENKVKKFADTKKKALDHNSDVNFAQKKKKPNQNENILNRSLGEECYFNY